MTVPEQFHLDIGVLCSDIANTQTRFRLARSGEWETVKL